MRILIVHNHYQHSGGEDQVFKAESELLEMAGHEVWRYTLSNDRIKDISALDLLSKTLWNQTVYQEIRSLICKEHIQLAHFHNTFPLVSPSAYYACKTEQIPVIQTCHNYRLLCPNAMFLRDGRICEDCLGKLIPLPGVQHKCYRGSRTASAGVAVMLTAHRLMQTWTRQVDLYIALTDFAKQKLIQGGIPAPKIVVKPNFIHPDPGYGNGRGNYALFVGRLSSEKGIDLLLSAWKQVGDQIPLKIVGDGPLATEVAAAVGRIPGVTWLGRQSSEAVYALMQEALFLVFPSRWYEGLPRTLIEAFAVGTPAIAANLGSISNLVMHGQTGLHFLPGDLEDLVTQILWAVQHPEAMHEMRQRARLEFEQKYTAEKSYQMLLEIYQQSLSAQARKFKVRN